LQLILDLVLASESERRSPDAGSYGPLLIVHTRSTRYTSLVESVLTVDGVDSARLVPLQLVVAQVPIPALLAADAIFTGDALSTLHALAHCSVGPVPVLPF
jgi:hypothetical protein